MLRSTDDKRPAHHRPSLFSLLLRGSALLMLGTAGLTVLAPSAQATTVQGTESDFFFTGSEQTYPVPAGTTEVTIEAIGASGGVAPFTSGTFAQNGADVTATVPLPANTTTLYVEVGGPGAGNSLACPGQLVAGGFNGGGAGEACAASGGGASDVRTTSNSTPLTTSDSRLVVAGGGGGDGGVFDNCVGTVGGIAGESTETGPGVGGTGADDCNAISGQDAGFGGTIGGTGGDGTANYPYPGGDGSLGQGGDASNADESGVGAGGGGGYYGGGAGGDGTNSGGGGGAGSSFWASDVDTTQPHTMGPSGTTTPEISITPTINETPANLSLTNTGAPSTVVKGTSFTYTLTASNTGTEAAEGVTISDTVPSTETSVSLVSSPADSCTATPTSSGTHHKVVTVTVVNCPFGAVTDGSVSVTIRVTPTTKGSVVNTGSVTASNVVASPATASATTNVTTH